MNWYNVQLVYPVVIRSIFEFQILLLLIKTSRDFLLLQQASRRHYVIAITYNFARQRFN